MLCLPASLALSIQNQAFDSVSFSLKNVAVAIKCLHFQYYNLHNPLKKVLVRSSFDFSKTQLCLCCHSQAINTISWMSDEPWIGIWKDGIKQSTVFLESDLHDEKNWVLIVTLWYCLNEFTMSTIEKKRFGEKRKHGDFQKTCSHEKLGTKDILGHMSSVSQLQWDLVVTPCQLVWLDSYLRSPKPKDGCGMERKKLENAQSRL